MYEKKPRHLRSENHSFVIRNRGRHDSRFGWLPVTTGYQNFGLRVVTGYHWYQNFSLRVVPVTTGYQNVIIRVVTGNYRLPIFWLRLVYKVTRLNTGYRLPSVTSLSHLSRLPVISGYQKIKILLVTGRLP